MSQSSFSAAPEYVRGHECPPLIRVVEVLAALSLTTDLASGSAFEKGLRTCLVAEFFAVPARYTVHEFVVGQTTSCPHVRRPKVYSTLS